MAMLVWQHWESREVHLGWAAIFFPHDCREMQIFLRRLDGGTCQYRFNTFKLANKFSPTDQCSQEYMEYYHSAACETQHQQPNNSV